MRFNFDMSLNRFRCDRCGNEFPIPYAEEETIAPKGCGFRYTFEGKEYLINDGEVKIKAPALSRMKNYSVICKCGNEVFNGKAISFEYRPKPDSEKSTLRKVLETALDVIMKIP